jgi:hypothetical protein
LRKGLRTYRGDIAWDRITKWEAGRLRVGPGPPWVAFVWYSPDYGFLGLHTTTAESVHGLTHTAATYLDPIIVTAEFP